MSLHVRVSRPSAEPWGFRLIGGAEYTMPLTIVKVQPGSPAEASGLLHGDTLTGISGREAASMRHEEAFAAIKDCKEVLELEVVRGHYDMVLEEEYQDIPLEDSDLPSEPTEVLPLEPPSLDADIIPVPELELLKPEPINPDDSRSQTASPFLLPTKPYRPFSTEPIPEIPDLESPIILNPGYHDEFGILKEVEDFLPKTKFKLPVSEQYDPEYGKEKKVKETKEDKRSFASEVVQTSLTEYKSVEEKMTREEIRFMEQMKKDIDLDRIEETAGFSDQTIQQTAINVVEESITKAVTVAEEIKREIDIELHSEEVKGTVVVADEIKKLNEVDILNAESRKEETAAKVKSEVKQVESTVKMTDNVAKETSVVKQEKKDSKTEQTVIDFGVAMREKDQVSSAKQEMEETIVAGSVERLKSNFNQEYDNQMSSNNKKESTKLTIATTQKHAADVKQQVKQSQVETKVSSAENSTTKTSKKSETAVKSGQKMSTSRLLAEQRAYTIGLQTIPNIRGNVHSSYHYDLLLKTFFIHLTDVMVALSRFILAEPVLSQSAKAENIATEETVTQGTVQQKVELEITKSQDEELKIEQAHPKQKETVEEKPIVREFAKERMSAERFDVENQFIEKKKSGCKMAQLIEHKSEELTNKMDAVITEFQTKAGIEETEVTAQEVAQEESQEEEKFSLLEESTLIETDMTQTKFKEISSELTSSVNESVTETTREDSSMGKSGKTTYRAIVESHVYTNKDAIFEEHFSETSSLQSGDATVAELTESILEEKRAETLAEETQKYVGTEAIESSAKTDESMGLQENKIEDSEELSLQTITDSLIAETVELDSKSGAVVVREENIKSSIEKLEEKYISTAVTDTQESKTEEIKSEVSTVDKVQLSELDVLKSKEVLIVEATEPKADFEEQVTKKRPTSRKPSTVLSEYLEMTVQKLKEVSPEKETVMTIQSNMEITSSITTASSTTSELIERGTKKEIEVSQTKLESKVFETQQTSEVQTNQESLTARTETRAESLSRLTLDLVPETPKKSTSQDSFPSSIETPTPASVPPTPITDEYMFRIQTTLPKCTGPQPSPDTPSPEKEFEHEDFGIVKKKLNPYIETEIQRIVYDPPLPTPVEVKDAPEFGIAQKSLSTSERNSEEEILEIERTSSLLASAIDKTIKSIEEYKEQVGMETRRESDGVEKREEGRIDDTTMYSSYVKEPVTTIYAEVKPVTNGGPEVFEKSNVDNGNTRRASQTETVLTGTNETDLQEISSRTRELQERFSSRTMTEKEVQESFSSQMMSENEVKEIKGYRPLVFDQEEIRQKSVEREEQKIAGYRSVQLDIQEAARVSVPRELTVEGETLGTKQGIISGLADSRAEQDSTELGKPGMSEQKIAELISGESEMLREAHVMGLKRVIASHMTRPDDSSVDFKKIKPVIDSLKDSAVLAALNDELTKTKEEKKQEERKWTTFLQKPERPTPKAKFGYHGWLPQFDPKQKPYKVEIKKQPKPKVAPDYKPERAGFETGPLPWEARAANEPPLQMENAEDPILIPEEEPEFYEAVDPMPESEVPDLEETGIPLPLERSEEDTAPAAETVNPEELEPDAPETEVAAEVVQESEVISEDMEKNRLAEQLLNNVQGMVDPNATLEQQLSQMRLQLAALAQLPGVIQQTLELVSKQLMQLSQTETRVEKTETTVESVEQVEEIQRTETVEEAVEQTQVSQTQEINQTQETTRAQEQTQVKEQVQEVKQEISAEEVELKRRQDEEQKQSEKEKKEQEERDRLDHESRQVKHHPTPRAGKPKPVFGPLVPQERPIVLTGGRKWRKPKDAYNEQFFTETLAAQAEIIQGNTKGFSYESVLLPYDERINFMKYEKPPISLEHLKDSDVYKMIHNMEQVPLKRTDLLTPVVAECDYREKCRSISPCVRGAAACDMP